MSIRKEIGMMVMNPTYGNWVMVEVEEGYSVLLKAEKLYSESKQISDYWRVSDGYLNKNFVEL